MASTTNEPAGVTDADVDALASDFLNCQFAADTYADWPLDRRLDGFLHHRGLKRLVEDGDTYELILERVMSSIGAKGCR